ncbi:MAG: metal-dependent hydrolase, partial [Sphingomonas sp.]
MAKATTPDDLTITPRDRRFGRDRAMGRWWLNN